MRPELLLSAYHIVQKHMTEESNRILKDRLARGLFEQRFAASGENREEFNSSSDGKPHTIGYQTEQMNGGMLIKTVRIEKEEYPEFRVIELEQAWLHNRLHALGLCKCGGS